VLKLPTNGNSKVSLGLNGVSAKQSNDIYLSTEDYRSIVIITSALS